MEQVLNVVDFDETLFRVPPFTHAGTEFKKPYEWFDNPKSLNTNLYRLQLIESVFSKLEDNNHTIILSHRVESTRKAIEAVLDKFNITKKFNNIILCERAVEKPQVLLEYLEKVGPTFDKIRIFEDSLVQINRYVNDPYLSKVTKSIEYWFVDKTELLQIDGNIGILSRERIQLTY
jgi:hypothetical protein